MIGTWQRFSVRRLDALGHTAAIRSAQLAVTGHKVDQKEHGTADRDRSKGDEQRGDEGLQLVRHDGLTEW